MPCFGVNQPPKTRAFLLGFGDVFYDEVSETTFYAYQENRLGYGNAAG